MNWIIKFYRYIRQEEKIDELFLLNSQYVKDLVRLQNEMTELTAVHPKEFYFNHKYPQVDLTYLRIEKDMNYQIDLRNFINPFDASIPIVPGTNDDEKALAGLKWIIDNIRYVPDKSQYGFNEYWAYSYQTRKRKRGDCEDGSILLYNILLKSGVPYWKMRLTAGWVNWKGEKVGHAYLNYYCEKSDKWVVLDWCYYPNKLNIEKRPDYKDEKNYLDVWFSWNQKYCFTKGLRTDARHLLNQ